MQVFQEKHCYFTSSEVCEGFMTVLHSTFCPKWSENIPEPFIWLPLLCCLLSALTIGTYLLKYTRKKMCRRLGKLENDQNDKNKFVNHLIPSSPTLPSPWPQTAFIGNNCWIWPTADMFYTSSGKIHTHTHTRTPVFFFFSSYTFWPLKLFLANAIHFCLFLLHSSLQ